MKLFNTSLFNTFLFNDFGASVNYTATGSAALTVGHPTIVLQGTYHPPIVNITAPLNLNITSVVTMSLLIANRPSFVMPVVSIVAGTTVFYLYGGGVCQFNPQF